MGFDAHDRALAFLTKTERLSLKMRETPAVCIYS